jgi:hypothetical protein
MAIVQKYVALIPVQEKLNYRHNNPVIDKILANPEDYVFSAARNYSNLDSELDVVVLDIF